MGNDQEAAELLKEARAAAVAIQESLIHASAATLRESLPLFEHAVDRLQRLHVILVARREIRRRDLAEPALELQKEVARLRILFESSGRFRLGWVRRLRTQVAGYTAQGAPSALPGAGRILAEG